MRKKLSFEEWLMKIHGLTLAQYLYDLNEAQQTALDVEYNGY